MQHSHSFQYLHGCWWTPARSQEPAASRIVLRQGMKQVLLGQRLCARWGQAVALCLPRELRSSSGRQFIRNSGNLTQWEEDPWRYRAGSHPIFNINGHISTFYFCTCYFHLIFIFGHSLGMWKCIDCKTQLNSILPSHKTLLVLHK